MHTTTIIVGAGHAGLAMSRRLTQRSIDHVVLERGDVANSWRTERWPGLRLLTPNWQTRLPGMGYRGDDPDGFMPVGGVADFITRYADHVAAPVLSGTSVESVRAHRGGYRVTTGHGVWDAPTVVIATGACNRPNVPPIAEQVPTTVATLTPMGYRGPDELPEGGVLVVGGSATGVQMAQEIHRSGRAVTLSVGEHVRLPRSYRGRDIFWWMEHEGVLAEGPDDIDDLRRARRLPSPQLIGSPARTLDLNALTRRGVRVVGRLGAFAGGAAQFSGALANVCTLADLKLGRLLDRFDGWAAISGHDDVVEPPERFEPTRVAPDPTLRLDLERGEIRTVLWATGYRADYSWLDVPVLDRGGRIRHDGGVVDHSPGLYVLGAPLLRRRASTYIHGAVADTLAVGEHLHNYLCASRPARASASSRSTSHPALLRSRSSRLRIASSSSSGSAGNG